MPCLVALEDARQLLSELPAEVVPAEPDRRQQLVIGLYLTVLFIALSKGPIFQARQRFGEVNGDFIDDHAIQLTFAVIYIAGLAMYRGAIPVLQRGRLLVVAVGGLCVVLLASSIWSYVPWRTGQQSVMFALGTAAAILAGLRARPVTVVLGLAASQQFGTLLGRWAIHRNWSGAINNTGYWQGIYYNRNSYGMTATLAAASTIIVIALVVRHAIRVPDARHRIVACAAALVLVDCVLIDATVLRMTRSLTPTGGVAVAMAVALLIALLPKMWRHRPRAPLVMAVMCLAGGALTWQVGLTLRDRLSRSIGRTPDLAGRTPIWSTVREYFWHRPVVGWGFFAVWLNPAIHKELLTKTYDVFEAHTGYYEIAVGAGFIGVLALGAALFACIYSCSVATCRLEGFERLWPLPVAMFVLAVNVTETYIAANVLPWALLVIVSAGSVAGVANRRWRTRPISEGVFVDSPE